MADSPDDTPNQGTATEVEVETETETETQAVGVDDEMALDLESATEYEQRIRELEQTVKEQRDQIEELNDLMLDLSTRVADGRDMGVCPDCHGGVIRVNRWVRADTIECTDCGRVFHEY